ncbi:MAG: hypothetical protein HY746_05660 [Elusimicrobia bacterium]|nr:hypothetical protein [Elusimicrobiota bacterium]
MAKKLILVFLFCLNSVLFSFGQINIPLEDKIKFEKALEQKIDEVLLRVLGPNQARAIVETTIDFTRIEKLDINSVQTENQNKNSAFKWLNISEMAPEQQLLPGFPMEDIGGSQPQNMSYQKQFSFPVSFIKKLRVTLILNRTVNVAESENLKNIVTNLLAMDSKRGDEIIMLRTPFAPIWKTLWHTPESINLLAKYAILTIVALVSLIVVSAGFLKLAKAMNTMAAAQATHQVSMEFDKKPVEEAEAPAAALAALPRIAGQESHGAPEEPAESEEENIVINVKPGQIELLASMIEKEEPQNIALVTTHLEPDRRKEFLSLLPSEISAKVMANIAMVRFVEPAVMMEIKDEIEKRLNSAVGGLPRILEMINPLKLKDKKNLMENLEREDPELAREVRSKVLFPEDLINLSHRELAAIVSSITLEKWAYILMGLPEDLKNKIKKTMADEVRQVAEEKMSYLTGRESEIEEDIEKLVTTAEELIKKGRISNPLLKIEKQLGIEAREDG